jgi:hypothetical protein
MPAQEPATDETIRAVVARLSRPHRSDGDVIERAAILAEGEGSTAIFAWIAAHAGPLRLRLRWRRHAGARPRALRAAGGRAGAASLSGDLDRPTDAVRELRRCVTDLGFKGLRVVPRL